jgi:hypothetical protein
MSDALRDLVRPVGEVEPPMDLLARITEREQTLRGGQSRLRLPRWSGWAVAVAGVVVVLAGLALAAHSRSDPSQVGKRPRPTRPVPNVRGKSILSAITTLQRAGFKVSVPEGFQFGSLTPTPTVGRETPLAGTEVPVGAAVTLTDSRYGCCIGSPAGVALRVPDLSGSTAQQAIRELRRVHLPWEIRLRPFFNEQRTLLTTVRVVGQSPAPGSLVIHNGFHVPTMTVAYPPKLVTADLLIQVRSNLKPRRTFGLEVRCPGNNALPAWGAACKALEHEPSVPPTTRLTPGVGVGWL